MRPSVSLALASLVGVSEAAALAGPISWLRWLRPGGGQHVLGAGDAAATPVSPPDSLLSASGFVSFGDSYSAGIGTGVNGNEEDCRRGDHAYPVLLRDDLDAARGPDAPAAVTFQWLSCTGASTEDLLAGGARSQIDAFNASLGADFATLSMGGNDLGFFDVMNACIFRFYSFYSGTCDAALARAEAALAAPALDQRLLVALLQILDRAPWEKKPGFAVAVTGYARFFRDDTPACDDCSLAVWRQPGPKLTRATRRRTSDLVVGLNGKLRGAVAAVNARFARRPPRAVFVDYDAVFAGHRLCEPGVREPDYQRDATWFFLVGGADSGQNGTAPPNGTASDVAAEALSPLSPLVDPERCLGPARRSGDWGRLAVCYMAMARHRDPSLRPAHDRILNANSMWYVPTYYGKTFHPVSSPGTWCVRERPYLQVTCSDPRAMMRSGTVSTRHGGTTVCDVA